MDRFAVTGMGTPVLRCFVVLLCKHSVHLILVLDGATIANCGAVHNIFGFWALWAERPSAWLYTALCILFGNDPLGDTFLDEDGPPQGLCTKLCEALETGDTQKPLQINDLHIFQKWHSTCVRCWQRD